MCRFITPDTFKIIKIPNFRTEDVNHNITSIKNIQVRQAVIRNLA